MGGSKESCATPRLWKEWFVAVLIATLPSGHGTFAQSATPPAVRIQRDYQLGQAVWPADLNRDGVTDLVSSSSTGHVQVSIGRGDGTFDAPVESSFQGLVLATADFNGDQRIDVIAARNTGLATEFVVLPGTGTAALRTAITIVSAAIEFPPFAVSADFDGDGKRDLVLPASAGAAVYPGRGDFTFGTPTELVTNGAPRDGIVADLDNDGRKDLITANGEGGVVSVFVNRGAFAFSPTDLPLSHQANDVTVADVNQDGRTDLLVAAGRTNSDSGFGEGFIVVFRGNGNGTFAAPVEYPVAVGPVQIVVGDFNRDGVLDVATGNRSPIVVDDCTSGFKTWDTVSILIGRTGGTFAAARSFSIGDQSLMNIADPQVDRYRNMLTSLNTSDLNGDHATDLIASDGAILFNIAAVTNRPPTVNAGSDAVILNDHTVVLRPAASDPDEDMLTYEIRDETGFLVSTYPNACRPDLHDGVNTFTVTVNDGHGHTASDTVVYTAVTTNDGIGQFADGRDIGLVAAAGSDAFDSTTGIYTVKGSGSDIWGTADEFHYVWTQWDGNFDITVRVDSVQNVNAWTKAGIMIRQNLNPGSAHASLFASPGKGVAFQRRPVENAISVHTAGPNTTAPVWLKLQRRGDVITAYHRKATADAWSAIGQETLTGLSRAPLVGLAVSSHADGKVATGVFSRVEIQAPPPLTGHAIGSGSGSFTTDGIVYTVTGRGADIWGSADAFFYVSFQTSNSIAITARVRSIDGAEAWTKAGVMIREDLTAGSRHAMAVMTRGKGVAMQYRPEPGGTSLQAANVAGTAPAWIRLSVSNGTVTSSWSTDGDRWTVLGTVHIPFTAPFLYVGLPVTSHNGSASASAVFDDVQIGSQF